VWNEFSYVYDTTNNQPAQMMTRRFAFDRKTAEQAGHAEKEPERKPAE
jgi:hypothetical protein